MKTENGADFMAWSVQPAACVGMEGNGHTPHIPISLAQRPINIIHLLQEYLVCNVIIQSQLVLFVYVLHLEIVVCKSLDVNLYSEMLSDPFVGS